LNVVLTGRGSTHPLSVKVSTSTLMQPIYSC